MNGAHVALMGRVTRQAELRYTQNGNAMLRVGVLVNDSKRRDDDPPEFADVTIWGEQAEQMAERLPIGTTVYIEGRARVRPWSAKDGTARASLDVSAWLAQPMGQIGRDAPRRQQRQDDQQQPRRMPEGVAVAGGRNTRQALGLEGDDDGGAWQ